jgi:hypothetical protein
MKEMYGSGVGISMVFEILGHFLFKGTGPSGMVMTNTPQMLLDTRHKNIYGLGWGSQ